MKEKEGQEFKEEKRRNMLPCTLIAICLAWVLGFAFGEKSNENKLRQAQQDAKVKVEAAQQEAEVKVEAAQQEAEVKVEAAQQEAEAKVEAAQQEAEAKVEAAQQQANSKVETLEKKMMEEYNQKKYALLEKEYAILLLLKQQNKDVAIQTILEDADNIMDETVEIQGVGMLGYLFGEADEQKILEYVATLKEVVEKYPLSTYLNKKAIWQLEKAEKDYRDKIQSAETFEKINALKKQCEENIALWSK